MALKIKTFLCYKIFIPVHCEIEAAHFSRAVISVRMVILMEARILWFIIKAWNYEAEPSYIMHVGSAQVKTLFSILAGNQCFL